MNRQIRVLEEVPSGGDFVIVRLSRGKVTVERISSPDRDDQAPVSTRSLAARLGLGLPPGALRE